MPFSIVKCRSTRSPGFTVAASPGLASLKSIVIAGHPAAGTGECETFTVPAAWFTEFRVPTVMYSVGAAAVTALAGGDFSQPAATSTTTAAEHRQRTLFMTPIR